MLSYHAAARRGEIERLKVRKIARQVHFRLTRQIKYVFKGGGTKTSDKVAVVLELHSSGFDKRHYFI